MAVEYPFLETTDATVLDGCLLHSPFIIAIRAAAPSDEQLLAAFGISHYHRCPIDRHALTEQVFITSVGAWTLVADDWGYTLWHAHATKQAAARWTDVFSFWIGDTDESYGFDLFEAGHHRRARWVDSPDFRSRVVTRDEGTPLLGESPALFEQHATIIVWTIAKALGISPDPHTTRFRRYADPNHRCRR